MGVRRSYNDAEQQRTGRNTGITSNGIVYCVDFDPSFTKYLPEDLDDKNICAQPYGVEFTLVNNYLVEGPDGVKVRTWDPWFDVPNTNRKKTQLLSYVDPEGNRVNTNPTDEDYALYAVLPPTYCEYPSPGRHTWDQSTNTWVMDTGFQALGRIDNIATNERCTDPPAAPGTRVKREDGTPAAGAGTNRSRTHPRDLVTSRQGSAGVSIDPNVYIYFGCGADDDDDDDGDGTDPCADDSNPCGNDATNVPTTNGASPTQDPLPGPGEGGYSTGLITSVPGSGPTAPPSPSFVPCSTQNADPDNGIAQGYCVCSGSTFAQSTNADVTPVNYCAYTNPLPAATTSIHTFPTTPTTTAGQQPTATPSPYVLEIYAREITVASRGESENTWWWEGVSFDEDTLSSADLCDHEANPILYSSAVGASSPATYPTQMSAFSLVSHASCSYVGPNAATVGSVVCNDGFTAACTAAPAASQTSSYIDCDSEDPSNGDARDWWYWHAYCPYH